METLSASELAKAASISASYASMILTGARKPPLGLALHIYRQTGWRHESIVPLSEEQINALGLIEQWTPRGGVKVAGSHHALATTAESASDATGQMCELSGQISGGAQ